MSCQKEKQSKNTPSRQKIDPQNRQQRSSWISSVSPLRNQKCRHTGCPMVTVTVFVMGRGQNLDQKNDVSFVENCQRKLHGSFYTEKSSKRVSLQAFRWHGGRERRTQWRKRLLIWGWVRHLPIVNITFSEASGGVELSEAEISDFTSASRNCRISGEDTRGNRRVLSVGTDLERTVMWPIVLSPSFVDILECFRIITRDM